MEKRTCSIGGCDRPRYARSWCRMHHARWRRHGDPLIAKACRRPAAERFWSRVNKNGPIPEHCPELGRCWVWTKGLNGTGYGDFSAGSKRISAHKWSYEAAKGPVPTGLELDHLCRNRLCVNPEHMEPVTHAENMRRAAAARTHCPQRHEYTAANTGYSCGDRYCRTCHRDRSRNYKRRKREEA